MPQWIWEQQDWPNFTWEDNKLSAALAKARLAQGRLLGIIQTAGRDVSEQIDTAMLAEQAIDTSAIEGEYLNRDSVRSSIAHRLGLDKAGVRAASDRYVEGLLDMLLDATENFDARLTLERLFGWQAALFPTGYSGIRRIRVGMLRAEGPMQIVSGRPGKETVHYQAPPAKNLEKDIQKFLNWFNSEKTIDGLLKAGVAHLWFELLHPFEDGNGRVGRAIIDLALAQDEQLKSRYYSISSAIMKSRKQYYAQLEEACRGSLNITHWLLWFLNCVERSVSDTIKLIDDIVLKSRFWERHSTTLLNERQIKVLNRLLDAGKQGFIGGMTTRKYVQLTRTSRATAYRELIDLVHKRCLKPTSEKGRSSAYEIDWTALHDLH